MPLYLYGRSKHQSAEAKGKRLLGSTPKDATQPTRPPYLKGRSSCFRPEPKSFAIFLAPAMIQFLASSFMRCMSIDSIDSLLLKTLAFLSFHISHVMRNSCFQPLPGEGLHGRQSLPILANRRSTRPKAGHQVLASHPRRCVCPDSLGVPAVEKDVSCRFRLNSTKPACRLMRPTSNR